MASKDTSLAKAIREQRAQQVAPPVDHSDYFIVDTDGFVVTQTDGETMGNVLAKFISNQGLKASVMHKGEILTTYTNGVLS